VDPVAKLLVAFGYVVVVASFPAQAVTPLAPFLLYPTLCAAVGGIPLRILARRILAVLPAAALLGAANPLIDRAPELSLGDLVITRGWLSFAAIIAKTLLIVSGALCLTALSGFDGICIALECLGLPRLLIMQLRLMFRHLSTLSDEVSRTLLAYRMRSGRERGVEPAAWGSVAGGVLVRTLERADRVHHAMLCRGAEQHVARRHAPLRAADAIYFLSWTGWFALCRVVDIPAVVGVLARSMVHG